jgi:hypothetical protein
MCIGREFEEFTSKVMNTSFYFTSKDNELVLTEAFTIFWMIYNYK